MKPLTTFTEHDTRQLADMLGVDELRISRRAGETEVTMRIARQWASVKFEVARLIDANDPTYEIGRLCFDVARKLRRLVDCRTVEIPVQEFTQLKPMQSMSPAEMAELFTTPAKKPEVKQTRQSIRSDR